MKTLIKVTAKVLLIWTLFSFNVFGATNSIKGVDTSPEKIDYSQLYYCIELGIFEQFIPVRTAVLIDQIEGARGFKGEDNFYYFYSPLFTTWHEAKLAYKNYGRMGFINLKTMVSYCDKIYTLQEFRNRNKNYKKKGY